jgi:hypothetical protein
LNNDGFPELVVCAKPVTVFTNQAGTNLARITSPFLNGLNYNGDATWVDYDNDGWAQLLLTSYGSAVMARNVSGTLKSISRTGFEFWQSREIASTGSYMSGTSLEAHFGLGDAYLNAMDKQTTPKRAKP